MAGLREKQKAERETRILDAALALFRAHGFDATRMEQIADQAEVSIGTLYNYFATKGDILVALVVLVTRETLTIGAGIVAAPPDDPAEAMEALAAAWIDHSFRTLDKSLWRPAFAMMIERPDTPSSRRFAENDAMLKAQAAELIAALQSTGQIAPAFDRGDTGLLIFNLIDRSFMAFVTDEAMSRAELAGDLSRQIRIVGAALMRQN